ncbi:SAM hydrolase/SAM-dependent halogenase family protein [Halovivax limisalsi]|uniref:SAM hydrolase/SAM-dependent halogenase family protein n=1 Tax=Halovivax limisalsi TaxID=1453760 RepID=UPI001FFCAC0F|nr:SAM-dependent chlorinase/fluorinase [Halovivax limisalsi]
MITLTSDFGSPYPAAMKGVIASRTDARLVDVSHELPRQDVGSAAFWLCETLPYFPPAVHLVVVDPGVGTERAALVVRAGDHVLVGPDNGVLDPVSRRLGDDGPIERYRIDEGNPESSTFHGRDVFAPAAATVHDRSLEALGGTDALTATAEYVSMELPEPTIDGAVADGSVLAVDDFGNCITNVPGSFVADADAVVVDTRRVPVVEAFDAVDPGVALAAVGSHGNLELDVNRGRGDETFGLETGDSVRIRRS